MKITSQKLAREIYTYDPDTGALAFNERPGHFFGSAVAAKRWNSAFAGKNVGTLTRCGYYRTAFNKTKNMVHRIIWLYVYGVIPNEIDHINGIRTDNRLENLRAVNRAENLKNKGIAINNKSGVTGVSWAKHNNKWLASINSGNKKVNLGYYIDFNDAVSARLAAEDSCRYHENHGARLSYLALKGGAIGG